MTTAGVVLAGGRSTRMGSDKASLPWGDTTLLGHVSAVVSRAVDGPVVVVRAAGQELPRLPSQVEVVEDPRPGLGPVQGMTAGLSAVADRAPFAYVAATDLPFLTEDAVRRLLSGLAELAGIDVLAVSVDGHPQWLAAAYRTAVASGFARALDAGERRVRSVVGAARHRLVDPADLDLDPAAFRNVNDPQAYARARAARTG